MAISVPCFWEMTALLPGERNAYEDHFDAEAFLDLTTLGRKGCDLDYLTLFAEMYHDVFSTHEPGDRLLGMLCSYWCTGKLTVPSVQWNLVSFSQSENAYLPPVLGDKNVSLVMMKQGQNTFMIEIQMRGGMGVVLGRL